MREKEKYTQRQDTLKISNRKVITCCIVVGAAAIYAGELNILSIVWINFMCFFVVVATAEATNQFQCIVIIQFTYSKMETKYQ